MRRSGFALAAALLLAAVGNARAESNGSLPGPGRGGSAATGSIIVALRQDARPRAAAAAASAEDRVTALGVRTGLALGRHRAISPALLVVDLDAPLAGAALADTLARLKADPDVAFAEPDGRAHRHALAADPLYTNQWYLQGLEPAAINAEAAWDMTPGSAGVVVAVLDTGVRANHPDLLQAGRGGRLLPGYDFVGPDPGGGFRVANDGDGWDANPADPGDWVTPSEAASSLFFDCSASDSSWHGTRVAGMIGAITNNGTGIAGGTWSGWILPVRVLGKCFGSDSGILAGMRWAAGLHVDGVPDNPYPARILNMSLGAEGNCSAAYRNVLDELAQIGVLVVASAGNIDGPVDYPANCQGVAGVAGLRHIGSKVGYSSFGPQVTIAAPGGNCINDTGPCLRSLDTTTNTGTTAPASSSYTDQVNDNVGTSFSAPQVASIAALMAAVNGNLKAPQFITRLRNAARPFPDTGVATCQVGVATGAEGCVCTTSTCGAGMADAPGSVTEAERPIAAIEVPASVSGGQQVVLDGGGSAAACSRNLVTYAWSVVSGSATIGGANAPTATVTAPSSGSFRLRLTVTDDHGAQDTADVTVSSSAATTTAPAIAGTTACLTDITPSDPGPFVDDGPVPQPSSGGGGGGGSFGVLGILLVALGAIGRAGRLKK